MSKVSSLLSLLFIFFLLPSGIAQTQTDKELRDQRSAACKERLAELNKQQQLIKIKYEQIRKENAIKRREERKRITAG